MISYSPPPGFSFQAAEGFGDGGVQGFVCANRFDIWPRRHNLDCSPEGRRAIPLSFQANLRALHLDPLRQNEQSLLDPPVQRIHRLHILMLDDDLHGDYRAGRLTIINRFD